MSEHGQQEAAEEELAQLSAIAERIGLPRVITPAAVGVELPTAAQLIAKVEASERELRRGRRRRWGVLALAAAVAVVAGVLVSVRPWAPDKAAAKPPPVLDYEFSAATRIAYAPGRDPSEELKVLARTAARTPVAQGAGSVQFVATDNWFAQIDDTKKSAVIVPTLRRTWMFPSGRVDTVEKTSAALRSDGRGLVDKASDKLPAGKSKNSEPAGSFNPDLVKTLPTEPKALVAAMLKDSGCRSREIGFTRSSCLYGEIVNLFTLYVVPQKTVSALWSALSEEHGFRLLGSVKDRAGRGGVGISLIDPKHPEQRQILTISVKTGQLLGLETILIRDDPRIGLKAPTVLSFTALMSSRWVSASH